MLLLYGYCAEKAIGAKITKSFFLIFKYSMTVFKLQLFFEQMS